MSWVVTQPSTGRSVAFDGEAIEADDRFEAWLDRQQQTAGVVMWAPTGPAIPVPPTSSVEAFALAVMYLAGAPMVATGDPPALSEWLDDVPGAIY